MKNPLSEKYWMEMKLLCLDEEPEFKAEGIHRYLIYARWMFQKGIVYLMNDDMNASRSFLRRSLIVYRQNINVYGNYQDYIRCFVIKSILNVIRDKDLLKKALGLLVESLFRRVMFYGFRDIFDRFLECELGPEILEEALLAADFFSPEARDKYAYEEIGDEMLTAGRLVLLMGKTRIAERILLNTRNLYKSALRMIPWMLINENSQWGRFQKRKFSRKSKNREYLEYRKKFRELEGNIPFYQSQCDLLLSLCRYLNGTQDVNRLALEKRFNRFFCRVADPSSDYRSRLGFLEELEWALIFQKYYHNILRVHFNGDVSSFFRMVL